jgi:hypothetical protein
MSSTSQKRQGVYQEMWEVPKARGHAYSTNNNIEQDHNPFAVSYIEIY